MLVTSPSNIKNSQPQQVVDYRGNVLNAVREFNMTIMETFTNLFNDKFTEDVFNEKISVFASNFTVEYVDDGLSYCVLHNDVAIWTSLEDDMPTDTDGITDMLFAYYNDNVSSANKVRKEFNKQ
jgi:hypothetical protein